MEDLFDNDTATRFSLLELDDTPPAADPEPAPAIPGTTINEGGRRAAAAERQMVADVTGLDMGSKGTGFGGASGLVYDEGTTMLESGVQKALAGRAEWDRLPTATAAAAGHAERIAAEQRIDYRGIPLSALRVDERGELAGLGQVAYDVDNGALRFTRKSWSRLRSDAPRTAALRENLNSWLPSSPLTRTLRTRNPKDGSRELFTAVSDKYVIFDSHEVLELVAKEMPGETRARVSYNPETTRLNADLTLQNPYEVEDDISVGRLHRFGVRLSTSDDGQGRITLRAYAERIACINCTLIPMDWAKGGKAHVGDISKVIESIRTLAQRAGAAMAEFADHWRGAHMTRVFGERYDAEDAAAAFTSLVDGGFVDVADNAEDTVERLVAAWRVEPGNTYQAINRAITRAAHEATWKGSGEEALEEQAGQLLYNRVAVCDQLGWAQA